MEIFDNIITAYQFEWLVSSSQILTFVVWIFAANIIEFLSNSSVFAGIGMQKNYADPALYCLDSAFEVFSGIVSVLLLTYEISLNPEIIYIITFAIPYAYKVFLGMSNAIKFCEDPNPFYYPGEKTSIIGVVFNLNMTTFVKL